MVADSREIFMIEDSRELYVTVRDSLCLNFGVCLQNESLYYCRLLTERKDGIR
jgi:hypothetical protein